MTILKRIVRFFIGLLCRIIGIDIRSYSKDGYEEAIAGSELSGTTQVGARGYSVQLLINEADKYKLSSLFREFAASHDLRFFDFRQGSKRLLIRRLVLFSPRGLHIHADMIALENPASQRRPTSPMMLVAATFANHDDWQPIIRDLDSQLRAQWPEETGPEQLTRVEPIVVPDLETWKQLSTQERCDLQSTYSYREEALPLMRAIVDEFRQKHEHIVGIDITDGPAIHHGGTWVISVRHPFIFDRRKLPSEYLGVYVSTGIEGPLPPEFTGQRLPDTYVWAPTNYERFVDRCGDEIRQAWGQPDMTRTEILDALIGRPFEQHLKHCREQVRLGKLPPFE